MRAPPWLPSMAPAAACARVRRTPLFGPRLNSDSSFRTQVIGQKLVVLASMIHFTFLTTRGARG